VHSGFALMLPAPSLTDVRLKRHTCSWVIGWTFWMIWLIVFEDLVGNHVSRSGASDAAGDTDGTKLWRLHLALFECFAFNI